MNRSSMGMAKWLDSRERFAVNTAISLAAAGGSESPEGTNLLFPERALF